MNHQFARYGTWIINLQGTEHESSICRVRNMNHQFARYETWIINLQGMEHEYIILAENFNWNIFCYSKYLVFVHLFTCAITYILYRPKYVYEYVFVFIHSMEAITNKNTISVQSKPVRCIDPLSEMWYDITYIHVNRKKILKYNPLKWY